MRVKAEKYVKELGYMFDGKQISEFRKSLGAIYIS